MIAQLAALPDALASAAGKPGKDSPIMIESNEVRIGSRTASWTTTLFTSPDSTYNNGRMLSPLVHASSAPANDQVSLET